MTTKQVEITDSNKSPLIQILVWMFLVIAVLAAIARIGTKLHMVKTLKTDDCLAMSATVVAVAQFITTIAQSDSGLGQHRVALDENQLSSILKCGYANDLLYITALGLAKVSSAATTINIAHRKHKTIIHGIGLVTLLWAATGLIVVLFQCQVPAPWDYLGRKCINRPLFWTYFCVVNIVTDLAIIAVMVENIRKIQTTWAKKALVISVFGSRILVAPAIGFQIAYADRSLTTNDPTFDMWQWSIIMALVQCLSILTICIPNLKPFLDSLESGQIRIDDLRRKGKSSSNGYGSYQRSGNKSGNLSSNHGNNAKGLRSNGALDTTASQRSKLFELVEIPKHRRANDTGNRTGVLASQDNTAWDCQSHTSQTILIQQTKTWHVDVETTRRDSSD
ncbi:hypothetical protein QQS21_011122 [Conoideocrella luteorostrata]|uniref:Rhodopsin domain-containing protein n=1 Tax=Conoideocrella luteorostrata TaxID=1105319 RepID=A0AAJ0CDP1_9HYPO|nr:hypothetical protein QQS21_011122 [Conoideocrella luteorostrata]